MIKKTYKISGMDCDSCAKMVELDLEDIGVVASCNYADESLDVEFDESKIEEGKIEEVVKQSGYSLQQPPS